MDCDDVGYAKGAYFDDIPLKVVKPRPIAMPPETRLPMECFKIETGGATIRQALQDGSTGAMTGRTCHLPRTPRRQGNLLGRRRVRVGVATFGPVEGGLGPACPVETPGLTSVIFSQPCNKAALILYTA